MDPAQIRVALFSGNYNYYVDGVLLVLNKLVAHLLRRGVQVLVIAPTTAKPMYAHAGRLVPVPSISLPVNPNYRIAWAIPRAVQRDLWDFRPNIVHLATPDVLGFAALDLARRRRLPAVATYHTHFASYVKHFGLGMLEPACWVVMRQFYNRCAETYVPTASMRDELSSKGIRCPMKIWEHGVDATIFNPNKRSLEWRRAQGIQDHELLVGYVGRITPEKAVDVFADVVQRLERSGRPLRYVMIGDGPSRPELQARMPKTIFPGFMPHAMLSVALASMDVFLYPSASETFGCVTLEALAAGVPAVVADATGSRDIVTNEREGFLCPPRQADDFAQRVLQLADDSKLRERMSAFGVEHAAARPWNKVLDEMIEHYRDVLARWPGRS